MIGTIRSQDLNGIVKAQRVLLNPLGYSGLDEWRGAVNVTVKSLIGADIATFQMPVDGYGFLYSKDYSPSHLNPYKEILGTLDPKFQANKRAARLKVWSRKTLWRGFEKEYYRSAYYNEYIVPSRAFDGVGAAVVIDGDAGRTAQILFHHDRRTGRKFGRRGLEILSLLQPGLDAGVHAFLRHPNRWHSLLSIVDAVDDAVFLFDRCGRLKHQNPAAGEVFRDDPQRERIRSSMGQVVSSLIDGLLRTARNRMPFVTPSSQRVVTAFGSYQIRGSYLAGDSIGDITPVMVTVGRTSPELPDSKNLRERFGFTSRESRVALLLADRCSNTEIAQRLCISGHTARHHTERVLQKLGVSSRLHVAARLRLTNRKI